MLRYRKQSNFSSGDDAECALPSDEKVAHRGASGGLGDRASAHYVSGAEDDFQPEYLLAHGSVLAGYVAHAVSRDGTPHAGDRLTPRIVPHHETVGLGGLIQVAQHHARIDVGHLVRSGDGMDLAHGSQIHDDAALQWGRARMDSGTSAVGDEWRSGPTRPQDRGDNIIGRTWTDDRSG